MRSITNIKRNNSIDFFRLFCAVLVVTIHTTPFQGINELLSFFVSNILARIAVPFFFVVAGYYYIGSLEQNRVIVKKTLCHLIALYCFWSLVYVSVDFMGVLRGCTALRGFIVNSIVSFLFLGVREHLWYMIALIYAVVIVTIFRSVNKIKFLYFLTLFLYIVGCLGCSYYKIGENIPILRELIHIQQFTYVRRYFLMGLPFFMSGYLIHQLEKKLQKVSLKILISCMVCCVLMFLTEICAVYYFEIAENVIITFALYVLIVCTVIILLRFPLYSRNKWAYVCKTTSTFMYYSHPLVIYVLKCYANIMQVELMNIMIFGIVLLVTMLGGLMISKINKKWVHYFIV